MHKFESNCDLGKDVAVGKVMNGVVGEVGGRANQRGAGMGRKATEGARKDGAT